ncbi:MAG: acireductone synthase [Myxococcota bacterium]|nr:acireductone synthase [Myxococcota bacterium]
MKAIVTDIEGTTTPITFVKDVLFPYAAAHLPAWIAAHPDEPAVAALEAHRAEGDRDVVATALRLIAEDKKVTPLKTLQGFVWEAGYAAGELIAPVYDDVAPALRAWHSAGVRLAVYSSGSVHAQRLLFGHTTAGDLSTLFEAWFDTTTGAKGDAASYARIAEALALPPGDIAFLSDAPAELAAARDAGLQAIGVARDGAIDTPAPVVTTFAAVQ